MKHLWLSLGVTVMVSACGGGSSAETTTPNTNYTQEEIEQALNLPLEPDESHPDYHTIKGVDDNGNFIRDDVERYIGLTYYPDMVRIGAFNEIAEMNTRDIIAYEQKDLDAYLANGDKMALAIGCVGVKYGEHNGMYNLSSLLDNTDERAYASLEHSAKMLKGVTMTLPSRKDVLEHCKTYSAE